MKHTRSRRIRFCRLLAVCSLATLARGQTTLLPNGGFEQGLTGWTAAGNVAVKSGGAYKPVEGTRLAAFNSGNTAPGGSLALTFPTTAGRFYRLGFAAGTLSYAKGVQRLEVSLSAGTPLISKTVNVIGSGNGAVKWEADAEYFKGDGSQASLTFRDASQHTAEMDLLLDNVSVIPVETRTLRVQSGILGGLPITVFPADLNGVTDGQTEVVRTFARGTMVDLTAPTAATSVAAPYKQYTVRFQKWRMDGADYSTNRFIQVPMNADHTLEPVYEPGLPRIVEQPVNVTVVAGRGAAFHVTVDPPDTHYGWRFNGAPINTQAALYPTYLIPRATLADQGRYDVVVGDMSGSVTSQPAWLTVLHSGFGNGGFETGFDRWNTAGNVRTQPASPAPEGSRVVGFNAGNTAPNGELWQTFLTSPGVTYLLTFQMGVLAYNTSEQILDVSLAGNNPLLSRQCLLRGVGGGKTIWQTKALVFTADSEETTIRFEDHSASTSSVDLLLDALKIEVVPESSAIVPAGIFEMGSPPTENGHGSNETLHPVIFANPLLVEKTETTWAGWNAARAHAARFGYHDLPAGRNGSNGDGSGTHPVTEVSWWDALKWCNLRSESEGLPPVYFTSAALDAAHVLRNGTPQVFANWNSAGYRIPTESEWENLCRAGTDTAFFNGPRAVYGIGDADATLDESGWYVYNSGGNTRPVGTKPANAWGMHDVHGNVWEWCWDLYADDYPAGPVTDPRGAVTGEDRVLRGGSFHMTSYWCRSAQRGWHTPTQRQWYLGFRVVRSLPQ